jgi:adenylosuccinate synthase
VTKAYATRVGAGPFVSELKDATGDLIRERGNEYGTTTGRPRRCGWFDAVSARYSARILSGFERVGICTGYRLNGQVSQTVPASSALLVQAEPVIDMVAGWSADLREVRRFEDLPDAARNYVQRIESLVGVPVSLVGVGPERSQTLVRPRLAKLVSIPESSTR